MPTHNPDLHRFRATLDGLRRQTLAAEHWTVVVVDNASTAFPSATDYANVCPTGLRVVREPALGLSPARRCGIREAASPFIVFADDDNVLAPDYLANVLAIFTAHPRLGLAGGKSLPQFDSAPPIWASEFYSLLALRDLGDTEILAAGLRPAGAIINQYPSCAPIGAGLAASVSALQPWLDHPAALSDRRGTDLSSAGDNDIVLCALRAGWEVGYFPSLRLTHLIPVSRLEATYLARLNRGIQKSWMQVLTLHDANPWPTIPTWTLPLRRAKMWFNHRAWNSPAGRIRWQGACGHFEGRIAP